MANQKQAFPFAFRHFWEGQLPLDLLLGGSWLATRRRQGQLIVEEDGGCFGFEKVLRLDKNHPLWEGKVIPGFLTVFDEGRFVDRVWVEGGEGEGPARAPLAVAVKLNQKLLEFQLSPWEFEAAKFALHARVNCEDKKLRESDTLLPAVFEILFKESQEKTVALEIGRPIQIQLDVAQVSPKLRRRLFEVGEGKGQSISFCIDRVEIMEPPLPPRVFPGIIFPLRLAHQAITIARLDPALALATPESEEWWLDEAHEFEKFGLNCLENLMLLPQSKMKKSHFVCLTVKAGDFCERILAHFAHQKGKKLKLVDLRDFLKFQKFEAEVVQTPEEILVIREADKWALCEEFLHLEKPMAVRAVRERLQGLGEKAPQTLVIWLFKHQSLEGDWADVRLDFRRPDPSNLLTFHRRFLAKEGIPVDQFSSLKFIFAENDIFRILNAHRVAALEFQKRPEEAKERAAQTYIANMKEALKDPTGMEIEVLDIPKVTWEDIGGLDQVKKEFELLFGEQQAFRKAELSQAAERGQGGKEGAEEEAAPKAQKGVIFFGPPGTGKTLLAKCLANTSRSSFISVKGPELLNMYVGESEKNMREVFEKAKKSAPCVLFFDELDSLLPARGSAGDSGNVTDRLVAQFLTELDSLPFDLLVIAATNRPDLLDSSILTSGKFDKKIYLGVFDQKIQRLSILTSQLKGYQLEEGLSIGEVEAVCPSGITGADFAAIVSGTVRRAIKRCQETIRENCRERGITLAQFSEEVEKDSDHPATKVVLSRADLEGQLRDFRPSVPPRELENYQKLAREFADITVGAVQ